MPITLFLVALLGAVFLKGFKEAIGIAVTLVSAYLALNLIVVIIGLEHIAAHPHVLVAREQDQREDNNIPSNEPIVFLEIYVRDARVLIKISNQDPNRSLIFGRLRRGVPATKHRHEPIEGALAALKSRRSRRGTVTSRQVRLQKLNAL